MRRLIVSFSLLVLCAGPSCSLSQVPVRSLPLVQFAEAGRDGRVHVTWSSGEVWIAPPEHGQAGVSQIHIAPDHRSVGWTVERDECCQSYPIPMVLMVARSAHAFRRFEVGQGIYHWQFEDGGRRFALFHDTSHGNLSPTCELYDTNTGKKLATWERGTSPQLPKWAAPFAEDVGPLTSEVQP